MKNLSKYVELLEEIVDPEPIEDDVWPSYSDKGNLLIEVIDIDRSKRWPFYRYTIGEFDYDADTSLRFVVEGAGVDWFMDNYTDLSSPGWYVIEGVHGHYYRGDWSWGEDDDEEFYFDLIRRASRKEVEVEGFEYWEWES